MDSIKKFTVQDKYAYFHMSNIPELPPTPTFAAGSEQFVRLGSMAVCHAGWGEPLSNAQLISHYVGIGWDYEEVREMIIGTGFKQGYYFHPDVELLSDEVQEQIAHYAARLSARVARARGWDAIDVLILGSSTSCNSVLPRTKELLAEQGIAVELAQFYTQACNGATAGINDLCRNPDMHGLKAVVIGMETLSCSRLDMETPITCRTFGNGGGAIAFIPGVEIQHITGRTVAEYDTQGVIIAPETVKLPVPEQRIAPPDWYEIVGEMTYEKFAVSSDGIFMEVPRCDDGMLRMNGMATLAYFVRRVPPLAVDVVQTYKEHFQDQYGALATPFSHQPSLPVMTFINQELIRLQLETVGIDARQARNMTRRMNGDQRAQYLKEQGINDFDPVQIPWMMSDTGFNNTSAGTSVVAMLNMIKDGSLTTDSTVPVFGFGIGSVIQADIWRIPATT
jgi:3-oxoacyl-[acyl-carrier-protein] synthase III